MDSPFVPDHYLSPRRKLRLDRPVSWDHHRGGWKRVVTLLSEHCQVWSGTLCLTAVEQHLFDVGAVEEPWVGFMHQVPRQNLGFPDLERILERPEWRASQPHCRGIWVLTEYQQRFLRERVEVPVCRLPYPCETPDLRFDEEQFFRQDPRPLYFVGEFLRNYQAFYDLAAPGYSKVLLAYPGYDPASLRIETNDRVEVRERVSVEEYDALLSRGVVFLNLFDAVANTAVIECVVRGTPVLLNRVGAAAEYVGADYPLLYDTLEQAAEYLQDDERLADAARHLDESGASTRLSEETFLRSLQDSAIYRSLPVPRWQRPGFARHDVTVVGCLYKRVHLLEDWLQRIAAQDFEGDYEVLLWNNNIEIREEVDAVIDAHESDLAVRVIHSRHNFYCGIRLAAPALARSPLLLICDDDVLPERDYISRFVREYRRLGPDVVLCTRGHVFEPHAFNEEDPGEAWRTSEHIRFFDESCEQRHVHFMHADNCLLPRWVLAKALAEPMDDPEFVLVDDYWLSYVIWEKIGVPIWKIRADTSLSFSESSEDASVSMYHSGPVSEQRVNFYVWHMRRGWPFGEVRDRRPR